MTLGDQQSPVVRDPGAHQMGVQTIFEAALAAWDAGLCPIPAAEDGSKRPIGPWKEYQRERPSREAVARMWSEGLHGLGLVCGGVSGGLEMFELEARARDLWPIYRAACVKAGWGDALDRVRSGYLEETPSGGIHLLWRCSEIEGNLKLARRLGTEGDIEVLFETRGEGGFVVVAPSEGPVHPTGKPWIRRKGGFDSIATITPEERRGLLEVARSFDALPNITPPLPPTPTGEDFWAPRHESWMDRVVEEFNSSHSWFDVLGTRGWTFHHQREGVSYWSRPWKDVREGHSATTNAKGTDRLIVFSSAVVGFEVYDGVGSATSYDRFGAWAVLDWNGDRVAAARSLKPANGTRVLVLEPDLEGLQDELDTGRPALWADRPVLEDAARFGLVGEFVEALSPHTEADPIGLLVTALTYFGASVGAGPHFRLSGQVHPPRVFSLLVGDSARARKGAADSMVSWIFHYADPSIVSERKMTGLNSGEGLIRAVRDPRMGPPDKEGNPTVIEEGVDDKRLLLVEPEFSGRLLPASNRSGSTIGGILRDAWDRGRLQVMTQNPIKATGAHVCVVGHTTADELVSILRPTDLTGGFLNRFLFAFVASSQRLPFGGGLEEEEARELGRRLRERLELARQRSRMDFAPSSREMWPPVYNELMDDNPEGPLGHLTNRGAVHVQRLALIYALMNGSQTIDVEHLEAGIAVWRYCRASAAQVVAAEPEGRLTGTVDGDRMLRLLVDSGRPWSAVELKAALRWNGSRVLAVRARLVRSGMVEVGSFKGTGGRPRTMVWANQ